MWPLHPLGWTLAFETLFYLAVAVMILAGRARDTIALLLLLAGLPLLGYPFEGGLVLWRMATNPILWEFAFGVGLARPLSCAAGAAQRDGKLT